MRDALAPLMRLHTCLLLHEALSRNPRLSHALPGYTTTIHTINSCVLKLSKLTVAVTVYRGTGGATLPKSFFVINEDGLRGGIEFGFTSTTPDRSVAVQYAGKAAATVISARMGMVDRGADISWLSQFSHEKASAALLRHATPFPPPPRPAKPRRRSSSRR